MLYEKDEAILTGLYKAASFAVQAIAYRQTGSYTRHLRELQDTIDGIDKTIIARYIAMKNGEKEDFDCLSETIFAWAKERIGY